MATSAEECLEIRSRDAPWIRIKPRRDCHGQGPKARQAVSQVRSEQRERSAWEGERNIAARRDAQN